MTTSTELQIPGYVAGTWVLDPVHTHVGFMIKHMMVSRVRGRFTTFAGQIVTAENPLDSSVRVSIEAASISTNNEMRDNHIRSADFFDAEHHPQLTFVSTGIRVQDGEFFLDGELSIRGTTRPITLTAQQPEFGPNPQGGMKAGFAATGQVNRMDFGVSYNGPIPGGGVALSEAVQLVLEAEADLVTEV